MSETSSKLWYWPPAVGAFIAVPTISGHLFQHSPFWSRWAPFVSLAALALVVLLLRISPLLTVSPSRQEPPRFAVIGIYVFLGALIYMAFAGPARVPVAFSLDSSLATSLKIAVWVTAGGILIGIGWGLGRQNNYRFGFRQLLIQFPLALFVVSSIATSSSGLALAAITRESPVLLPTFAVGTSALVAYALTYRGKGHLCGTRDLITRSVIYVSFVVVACILALRSDAIGDVSGSYFHVGYFSGVIQTIRSGGHLLWDTPSQYGFLNALIPAWLPIEDSHMAFYWFQAVLMFVVVIVCLVSLTYQFRNAVSLVAAGILFVVAFFFAHPALIGPQPFPSSSAVRFGPSLVLVAWLVSQSKIVKLQRWQAIAITGCLSAIGVFWSAESAVYIVFILTGWAGAILCCLTGTTNRKSQYRHVLAVLLTFFAFVGLFAIIYSLATIVRVGSFPDWSMFVFAPIKFAQGFGSIPLRMANPAWILVVLLALVCCIYLVHREHSSADKLPESGSLGVIGGALLGWGTYYVGRAVPENIIAMYPQIVFCCLLVVAQINSMSMSSSPTDIRHNGGVQLLLKTSLVFCISVVTVLFVSIVGQSDFANTLLKIRTLPQGVTYAKSASAPLELVDALAATRETLKTMAVDIPVPTAYEGFSGILPVLPRELRSTFNPMESWIPVPLALLEEPIPPKTRSLLVGRFAGRVRKDGILVWDKANSFPIRFTEWMQVLEQSFKCSAIFDSDQYQIQFCKSNE